MKGKSSSIFKKVLQDSGFERSSFDTIPEVDDEVSDASDASEGCKTKAAISENPEQHQQTRRPVSPKRVRRISLCARKLSVPKEVWLNKTPRKQCEIRHTNHTLNKTLSLLLQRTNSLTEELHKGRKAIEHSLDIATAVRDGKTTKEAEQNSTATPQGKLTSGASSNNVLYKRERQNRPMVAPRGAAKQDSQKQVKQDAHTKDKNDYTITQIPDIKQTQSPRQSRVNFTGKDSKLSGNVGQTSSLAPPKGQTISTSPRIKNKYLPGAVSLPNLQVVHLAEKPRSRSFNDSCSKTETGKTMPLQGASSNRNGLISLRPPKPEAQRSSLLQVPDGTDDTESSDSRSMKSSTTSSSRSDKVPKKVARGQCYKTKPGEMVKMANIFSIIGNESKHQKSEIDEELTWTQIRHCRYLRNHVASPDFCTCNQCESFKRQ